MLLPRSNAWWVFSLMVSRNFLRTCEDKKGAAPIDGGPSKIFASFCGMGPPGEESL